MNNLAIKIPNIAKYNYSNTVQLVTFQNFYNIF